MARSLLDAVDLARVRAAAAAASRGTGETDRPVGARPAGATALACLVAGGALQHDPDDPGWVDRDRLVLGGRDLPPVAAAVFAAAGVDAPALPSPAASPRWIEAGSRAVAVATGLGVASVLDGAVWRVYAVVEAAACDDGVVWEAVRAAAGTALPLTVVVTGADRGSADRAATLLDAAGWPRQRVPAGDPAALLAGLDHALAETGPAAVVERP